MSFLRRSFSRKQQPDRLLEISQRIYVLESSLSTSTKSEKEYKSYLGGIVTSLHNCHPGASFMVFNFQEGDQISLLSDMLIEYDMTVVDYPHLYEGYPLLPLEMIHCFLRSSDSWLSLEGQKNVILMHCEKGGWPVLAFMLAGLLLYRKQHSGEQKTLEMVYKQAPKELNSVLSPINPLASQLRYLQYITGRDLASEWPPSDAPMILDYLLLRNLPLFDGGKGCRPVIRVYGQDPSAKADRNARILFTSLTADEPALLYSKEDCVFVKLELRCQTEGDVILECIHLHDDQSSEEMIFKVMFHTGFIQSNILALNYDEIDVPRSTQLPKDFKAEVIFRDMNEVPVNITLELGGDEESHDSENEFFEVEEILTPTSDIGEKRDFDAIITPEMKSPDIIKSKDYTLRNGAPRWDLEIEEIDSTTLNEISLGEANYNEDYIVESDMDDSSKNIIVVDSFGTEIHDVKEIDETSIEQNFEEEVNYKQASEAISDISNSSETSVVVDSFGRNILDVEEIGNTFIKQISPEEANYKQPSEVEFDLSTSSKNSKGVDSFVSKILDVQEIGNTFIEEISPAEAIYKQPSEAEFDIRVSSKNIKEVDSFGNKVPDVQEIGYTIIEEISPEEAIFKQPSEAKFDIITSSNNSKEVDSLGRKTPDVQDIGYASIKETSPVEANYKQASEAKSNIITASKNSLEVDSIGSRITDVQEIAYISTKEISPVEENYKQASEAKSDIITASKNSLEVDSFGSRAPDVQETGYTSTKEISPVEANYKQDSKVESDIITASKNSKEVDSLGSRTPDVQEIGYSSTKEISPGEKNCKQASEAESDTSTASKNVIVVDSFESEIQNVKVEIDPKPKIITVPTKPQLHKKNRWQDITSKTIKQQRVISQWVPRAKTSVSSEAMKPKVPVYKWVPKGPTSPAEGAGEE